MIQFLKSRRKTDIWQVRFDRRPSIAINVNKSYRGLDRERKNPEKLQVSNEQEGEEGVPRHLGRVP